MKLLFLSLSLMTILSSCGLRGCEATPFCPTNSQAGSPWVRFADNSQIHPGETKVFTLVVDNKAGASATALETWIAADSGRTEGNILIEKNGLQLSVSSKTFTLAEPIKVTVKADPTAQEGGTAFQGVYVQREGALRSSLNGGVIVVK